MKIVAITQARISSTRLPGKVMKKIKNKPILQYHVDQILKSKLILVSLLVIVAIICVPIISWPGDKFKFLKHLLEWDYFLGVITFYLLTFFMWKKIT